MRVTPRAVRDLARNAGVPEDIIVRHIDSLVSFTFTVAQRERKACRKELREWLYSTEADKPDLKDLLRITEDTQPYDIV